MAMVAWGLSSSFSVDGGRGGELGRMPGRGAAYKHMGGKHKAHLFDSPILLPRGGGRAGERKKLHETAVRYGPLLASSGHPSIPRNSRRNGRGRDKWMAVDVEGESLTITQ